MAAQKAKKYSVRISVNMEQTTDEGTDNKSLFETVDFSDDLIPHATKVEVFTRNFLEAAAKSTTELTGMAIAQAQMDKGK